MRQIRHYLLLILMISLGAFLRWSGLDAKPLWLDEIITALFSLGHNYNDIPLNQLLSLSQIDQVFTLNPEVSCPQIAENLIKYSTHPPLFFCLLSEQIKILDHQSISLTWLIRFLPALFGVLNIIAIYYLNRLCFSPRAGLMAATMMAVSPFAVYLSQEGRHYTLPMLLITLSLIFTYQIFTVSPTNKLSQIFYWCSWILVNTLGLYVHYFCLLAYVAQVLMIIFCRDLPKLLVVSEAELYPLSLGRVSTFLDLVKARLINVINISNFFLIKLILPVVLFMPWRSALLTHSGNTETSWMPPPLHIAPLYQTIASWMIMIIAFPVEKQPLAVKILSAILMILVFLWVIKYISQKWSNLWQLNHWKFPLYYLTIFTSIIGVEFLLIIYLWQKDLTVAPRYHFVYFPAICAGLGIIFTYKNEFPLIAKTVILCGIISSILSNYNLVFLKSYHPDLVAQKMGINSHLPLVVVIGSNDTQDVALGLSFAEAIERRQYPNYQQTYFTFMERGQHHQDFPIYEYITVWQKLSNLANLPKSNFNLWIVAPGLKAIDFPEQLPLKSSQTNCIKDESQYDHVGVPYQLYQCQNYARN